MVAQWTPMRWPNSWNDPAALSLLKGTATDYLLIGRDDDLAAVLVREVNRFPELSSLSIPVVGPRSAVLGRAPFPSHGPLWKTERVAR